MLQVNRSIARLGLNSCDLDTDCLIALATVLQGSQSIKQIDLSRPLLHSRMEETTIHISKMLQVLYIASLLAKERRVHCYMQCKIYWH